MQVKENTTSLYFVPSEGVTNPRVIITDETTNKDVYDKTLSVNRQSYYYVVTDSLGFGFKFNNHYIMEVYESGVLVYRANLYSSEFAPRNEFKTTNLGESNNEYITI